MAYVPWIPASVIRDEAPARARFSLTAVTCKITNTTRRILCVLELWPELSRRFRALKSGGRFVTTETRIGPRD